MKVIIEGSVKEIRSFLQLSENTESWTEELKHKPIKTPKASVSTISTEASHVGRPEDPKIREKMDKIIAILEEKSPSNLAELNDLLLIKDDKEKARTRYYLEKLVNEGKVSKDKDSEGHTVWFYKG